MGVQRRSLPVFPGAGMANQRGAARVPPWEAARREDGHEGWITRELYAGGVRSKRVAGRFSSENPLHATSVAAAKTLLHSVCTPGFSEFPQWVQRVGNG